MSLDHVVKRAWRAFDRVAGQTWCVNPAVPILFFGDLDAYRASPLRVLTVGLNPSRREFPADQPFQRFPRTEGISGGEPSRYLDAMSAYFRTDPYRAWFSAYEPLLNGMDASYYDKHASTALHTDICSPVATDPTWSGLDAADRAALESEGGPLWHMLLEELKPQIVALSVAKRHLERINFMPLSDWTGIDVFERKANGEPRSEPYEIRGRSYDVGGGQSLFIFGRAAIKPFGLLDNNRKSAAGASVLKAYQKGHAKRCFVQFPHPGGSTNPTVTDIRSGIIEKRNTGGNSCSSLVSGLQTTTAHAAVNCGHGANGSPSRTSFVSSTSPTATGTIRVFSGIRTMSRRTTTRDCTIPTRLSSENTSSIRTAIKRKGPV